jgi:hypothetical protein
MLPKKCHITFTSVFRPFTQYFVKAPLAAITASSLLGYDAISLAHLYLGSFSHYSLQILSSSVRLDGERRFTAIFRSLQRCLDWVQFRVLAGPLKDIQKLVLKPLLCCLGCVLRVVVLLEGGPSPQSEVLSDLEQVFIKVLCSVHLCLNPH